MKMVKLIGGILCAIGLIGIVTGAIVAAAGGAKNLTMDFGRQGFDFKIDGEFITEGKRNLSDSVSLSDIKTLRIHIDAATVELRAGTADDDSFSYEWYTSNSRYSVNATKSGDTLTLRGSNNKSYLNFNINSTKIIVTVPASFLQTSVSSLGDGSRMELNFNACDVNSKEFSCDIPVDVSANACDINLDGLSGKLTADLAACDADFGFDKVGGNIRIGGNAATVTVKIPADTSATVNVEAVIASFKSDFSLSRWGGTLGDSTPPGGGGYEILLKGAACDYNLRKN